MRVNDLTLSKEDIETKKYFDKLKARIRKLGFNPDMLLYRGFDGANLETLLREGTDEPWSDFIYATDSSMIEESGEMDVFEYAFFFDKPCISVYDKNKFHKDEYCYCDDFVFNDPSKKLEALLAIFKIKVKR